jgi:DNA repair protein RadC
MAGTTDEKGGPPVCRIAVYRARLECERYFAFPWREYEGPADALALFRRYVGVPDREHLVAIHLDARSRVSGIHTVSIGSLQRGDAGAREVFKTAILGSAAEIVLAHNHPSGDPSPSPDDVLVTQGLEFVGQLLQIPVVDHVIIGDPGIASLSEMGLLEFDPHNPDPLDARHTDEGWATGLEALKFAAALRSGGMPSIRRQAKRALKRRDQRGFLPAPARCATLNPTITVEPDPSLRPGELEPLLEELQRRVGAALERALGGVPATVRVDDVGLSFAEETPVFPIAAGERVFSDSEEIAEELDAIGSEAGVGAILHDAAGRAFLCSVSAGFIRCAAADKPVNEVFTLDDGGTPGIDQEG